MSSSARVATCAAKTNRWKAGPLDKFAYLHDKFATTKSFAATLQAVAAISRLSYLRATAGEAMAAAAQVLKRAPEQFTVLGDDDRARADSFRLALVSIVLRSWNKRRRITTQVVDDLSCYVESAPRIGKNGLFDLTPKLCDGEQECCLADALKSEPKLLEALRKAIPENSARREDSKRRQALKKLIKHPGDMVDRDTCRALGDAIFAFFCPKGAVVLTTNIGDHERLAKALGKKAEKP